MFWIGEQLFKKLIFKHAGAIVADSTPADAFSRNVGKILPGGKEK